MSDDKAPFVFLGGTSTGYDWRKDLIGLLNVNFFNPLVDDWTEEDAKKENIAKGEATMQAYCITPHAIGSYSVAELTASAILNGERTVVLFMDTEDAQFDEHQKKSNTQIKALVEKHSGKVVDDLEEMAKYINDTMGSVSKLSEWARPE